MSEKFVGDGGNPENPAGSLSRAFSVYSDKPLFGTRNGSGGKFEWKSYFEIGSRVEKLACSILQLAEENIITKGSSIAICSAKNREEWLEVDFACCLCGILSIGIHSSLPQNEIDRVLTETNCSIAFVSYSELHLFQSALKENRLKLAVCFDSLLEPKESIKTIQSFIENPTHKKHNCKDCIKELGKRIEYSPFHTVIFSSGTTGTPKGLGITKKRWQFDAQQSVLKRLGGKRMVVSHSPLAHGMDRGGIWQTIYCGGMIGFIRNDFEGLLEDCEILKPRMITIMPHFWNRLYSDFKSRVHFIAEEMCFGSKVDYKLIANVLSSVILNGRKEDLENLQLAKEIKFKVMNEFKMKLGGEIALIGTGGSKTGDNVLAFLRECFSPAEVIDAYGTTEVPGISSNGIISSSVQVKLIDVPEQGYLLSDKPNPRGEIICRSNDMVPNYWGNSLESTQATENNFKNGWYYTGDIGSIDSQTGKLTIIDRRGGLIELYIKGRSVWIPASVIESILLESSQFVRSICLCGDRAEGSLIAIVVIKKEGNQNLIPKYSILKELREIGLKHNLKYYEIPKAVIVSEYQWSVETGELSSTNKLCRSVIISKFKPKIDAEYSRLETIFERRNAISNQQHFDFIDYRFICDEEEDSIELNKIMDKIKEYALKLREILPISSAKLKENEAKVKSEITNAKQNGLLKVNSVHTVREKISEFISMREEIQKLHILLTEAKTASDPNVIEQQTNLRLSIELLCELAEKTMNVTVPYQIKSGSILFSPKQMEERGGSCLAEAPGFENWQVWCCCCGDLIEWGSEGSNSPRWKCMDCLNAPCYCSECYSILISLKTKYQSSNENELLVSFAPHLNHILVKEFNHQIWLRDSVVPSQMKHSPASIFLNACQAFKFRPCLGMPISSQNSLRPSLAISKKCSNEELELPFEHDGFIWLRYTNVLSVSIAIAKGLLSKLQIGDFVGICGDNSFEWSISDFACSISGLRAFGIHTTMNSEEVSRQLTITSSTAIICSIETFHKTVSEACQVCKSLKLIILLDTNNEQIENTSNNIPIITFEELSNLGKDIELPNPSLLPIDGPTGVFTLLFTSGTSAVPKAAVVSADTFWNDVAISRGPIFAEPLITCSYIPLSHSSDRSKLWEFLTNGGRIGFIDYSHSNWIDHEQSKKDGLLRSETTTSYGVERIFEKLSLLRPTAVSCPPRIFSGLYNVYKKVIKDGNDENIAKQYIRSLFGDRIAFVATGGAPTAPEIMDWIKELFPTKVSFIESYGTTECGGITEDGKALFGVQIMLAPVKHLGLEGGNLGEICVKTTSMFSGYLGKSLSEILDSNGFFHTGDLGKFENNGKLIILERIVATEICDGELFSPNQIEAILETSSLVSNVFVQTNKQRNAIVALVVSVSENSKVIPTEQDIFESFNQIALKNKMKLVPKYIKLISEPWTVENGLLNGSFKKARSAILNRYYSLISELISK